MEGQQQQKKTETCEVITGTNLKQEGLYKIVYEKEKGNSTEFTCKSCLKKRCVFFVHIFCQIRHSISIFFTLR